MVINSDYPCNAANYRKVRRDSIKYIVIHYVGAAGSAADNAKYYANTAGIGASAHYFVGHASEGGAVYQSVPDASCAWHCGSETGIYYHECRNESSIGIEMCCHYKDGTWYFDSVTVDKTIELVKMLMKKYSIPIGNVIRHYDVTHKKCPAPYAEDAAAWQEFKRRLDEVSELESVNDIVWELAERGIISDTELWLKKLEADSDADWLARKAVNYIVHSLTR